MEAPERVIWSEGMLLSPQHFQQETLYHERLLAARLNAIHPHNWGVVEVEIEHGLLAAGKLRVRKFIGVLPGGLPLAFEPGKRAGPAARTIEKDYVSAGESLEIFLGLRREREGAANVGSPDDEEPAARFTTVEREVRDLNDARTQQVAVTFARVNVELLLGEEANGDYDSIQIGELLRTAQGDLEISETFVPPCLRIGASPFIMAGCRSVLELITTRQKALQETTREATASASDLSGTDLLAFLHLSTINAMVPVVRHLTAAPMISPWQAYLALIQVTGALSTYSAETEPAALPELDYQDLGATFGQLFDRIAELLASTVVKKVEKIEKVEKVELKLFRNGVMVGPIEGDKIRESRFFILTAKPLKPEVIPEKMSSDVPKLSKIGAKGNIKSLIQTANNGVPLQLTREPPPEVPVREGVICFQLDVEDDYWQSILDERNIALFIPKPYHPGNVQYELLAIPPA